MTIKYDINELYKSSVATSAQIDIMSIEEVKMYIHVLDKFIKELFAEKEYAELQYTNKKMCEYNKRYFSR